MQNWLYFWSICFWLIFSLILFNPASFLNLLIYSELVWIVLYCFSLTAGIINDDLNLMSTSFFLLALAGIEFSFGFLLIILFKNFNQTLNIAEDFKVWLQYTEKTNFKFVV